MVRAYMYALRCVRACECACACACACACVCVCMIIISPLLLSHWLRLKGDGWIMAK